MKITTKAVLKFSVVSAVSIAISGCASLRQKTMKAPCGPLAGLTDPCGDRIPINTDEEIDSIFASELFNAETV